MRCSKADLPASIEVPEGTSREIECGGMFIEYVSFQQEANPGLLLTGLPDDLCPSPH